LTKFGIIVEDFPGEVLDTLKLAWVQSKPTFSLHYCLYKKGTGIVRTMGS
jgi:hypothetical protein